MPLWHIEHMGSARAFGVQRNKPLRRKKPFSGPGDQRIEALVSTIMIRGLRRKRSPIQNTRDSHSTIFDSVIYYIRNNAQRNGCGRS
jgi:hypothetical protein